jgi:hypothetical protein
MPRTDVAVLRCAAAAAWAPSAHSAHVPRLVAPVQLVWRAPRTSAAPTSESLEAASRKPVASPAFTDATHASEWRGGNPGSRANAAPPSGTSLALDNAAVDRLTDDVVRRVEKRIRIERERRGL